ncbi:conserved protein of unknown function precursor containing a type B C-terminal secretion signal [Tenacibaculum sp. 190130A14a]|uniref:T9SS type B sorting domain-containing protein n=1 Tax=Tenacibaculum polynesiense TaxID=3137857 RepID=A0ABP1F0E7_9FLAO
MKKLILLLFLHSSIILTAQNEANFWYFGRNAGLDFSTGVPVALTNGQLNTLEGCSSISDQNGNLLFYSDGIQVWDRNHNLMPNGTGLLGDNSSTQSGLIVPNPSNTNIYYLFTVDAQEGNGDGFRYSIIDMSLNGGNGDVTTKNVLLVGSADEKVTSVVGRTCDSFWVITADRDNFYAFEVTSTGVNTTPVISPIGFFIFFSSRGYLKLSPDGTKLVQASSEAGSFIYDFSATTGVVSNGRRLNLDGNIGYGVEFSISGNKLYIATGPDIFSQFAEANLYQFDISNPDITIINNSRGTPFFTYRGTRGAFQLGPDGKIYHAVSESPQLGVINNPENDKNSINYVHNGVNLNGRNSAQGLPPFIQSFFLPTTILNADTDQIISDTKQFFCAGQDYRLKAGRIEPGATYSWEKDGNIIGTDSILTINDVNWGSGIYKLTTTLKATCAKTLDSQVEVEFVPAPTIVSVPPFEKCDSDTNPNDGSTTFDLSTQEAALTNNATNVTVEFFSLSDTTFSSPLPKTNYINTSNPETLVVRVNFSSSGNTGCFSLGTLSLAVNEVINNTNISDVYVCEIDENANNPSATNSIGNGQGTYDFNNTINEILTLNPTINTTTHTINFYRTQNDANAQNNPILAPYNDDFFTNASDIFVRVSLNSDPSCFSIFTFTIFVESLPIPQGNSTPTLLCVNFPIGTLPLATVSLDASTGNSNDTYQWYFNGNSISNATNAVYEASEAGTYRVETIRQNSQLINPCHAFNTFEVIASSKAVILDISVIDDSLNNNSISISVDGLGLYDFMISNSNLFLNGTNSSITFSNLPIGIYTITIRDRNGCGDTISDEIPVIFFQRHFTPNDDGVYDTWKIQGVDNDFFRDVTVKIYDRYGKQVAIIPNKNHRGWDGFYNGSKLPSTDYWYNAQLIDKNGKVRTKKSHFSLLRR